MIVCKVIMDKKFIKKNGGLPMFYYYPSCTFRKALPKTASLVINYLKDRNVQIMGCCRGKCGNYQVSDTAIVICQSCRDTLKSKMKVISLWEYLLRIEDFPWPDYRGLKVNIQDCWRERFQSEVQSAVRDILKKMNIETVEVSPNLQDADFCGTLHYEIKGEELADKVAKYPQKELYKLPPELQKEVMRERTKEYTCEYVVCDCTCCLNGVQLGGNVKGIHLLELIFQTAQL